MNDEGSIARALQLSEVLAAITAVEARLTRLQELLEKIARGLGIETNG